MKKKILNIFVPVAIVAALAGCKSGGSSSDSGKKDDNKMSMQAPADESTSDSIRHAELNKLQIANRMEPSCGMPMARGFEDTATYDGKLLGFCSKECRDDFMKDPSKYKVTYK